MPDYRTTMALLLLSCVLVGFSRAAHPFQRQGWAMQNFEKAIQAYHDSYGSYPKNDQQNSWYQKILTDDPNQFTLVQVSADGRYPLDYYGYQYIYESPNQANGNQVVIRSIGENGVDDGGTLDDWDSRFGPNYGYWLTMNWPIANRRAIICIAVYLVGLAAIWSRMKNLGNKLALSLILLGLLGWLVMPWGFDTWPGSIDPRWIAWVQYTGGFVLIGGLFLGYESLRSISGKFRLFRTNPP